MAVDYSILLTKGTSGIKKHIDVLLTSCKDDSKREFYETCKACLNAVERFSERYADRARQLAVDAESERKAEFLRIAEICERVPKYPAESFYEAVQSINFLTLCLSCNPTRFHVCEVFRLGRIDRLLYPYYKADRDAGIIDDAFAQLLIDCLGIMINHRVLSGLSSGYMVGGRNADGTVVANELTYMGIRAIDDIRLSASIKKEAERYRGIRERRMQTGMMPLLSSFVNDCLERGLDIEKGGAR